jgi:hypothetical protein
MLSHDAFGLAVNGPQVLARPIDTRPPLAASAAEAVGVTIVNAHGGIERVGASRRNPSNRQPLR